MSLPKATHRDGSPKPQTFLEAQATLARNAYRLLAEIARALRLHALADRWMSTVVRADVARRRYRRQVMGDHYDGL